VDGVHRCQYPLGDCPGRVPKYHFPQGSGKAGYAHVSVALSEVLGIHGEVDWTMLNTHWVVPPIVLDGERTLMTDYALGCKWAFVAHMVLKAEAHWNDGILMEDDPQAFLTGTADLTRYVILSLSASF
jgi:hypothetical protein